MPFPILLQHGWCGLERRCSPLLHPSSGTPLEEVHKVLALQTFCRGQKSVLFKQLLFWLIFYSVVLLLILRWIFITFIHDFYVGCLGLPLWWKGRANIDWMNKYQKRFLLSCNICTMETKKVHYTMDQILNIMKAAHANWGYWSNPVLTHQLASASLMSKGKGVFQHWYFQTEAAGE